MNAGDLHAHRKGSQDLHHRRFVLREHARVFERPAAAYKGPALWGNKNRLDYLEQESTPFKKIYCSPRLWSQA